MARITRTRAQVLAAQACLGLLVWVIWRMTHAPEAWSPSAGWQDAGWSAEADARGEPSPDPEHTSGLLVEPESPHATAVSECEAACTNVFLPQPSGLADSPRRPRDGLRRLPGARSWWVDARSGREHSARICGEIGSNEVECAWVMPLEALVQSPLPGRQTETRYRAALSVAEGLLHVQLFVAGVDGPRCSCLPFDLRAVPERPSP